MKKGKTVLLQAAVDEIGGLEKVAGPVERQVFPRGPHGMGLAMHDSLLREGPARLDK